MHLLANSAHARYFYWKMIAKMVSYVTAEMTSLSVGVNVLSFLRQTTRPRS